MWDGFESVCVIHGGVHESLVWWLVRVALQDGFELPLGFDVDVGSAIVCDAHASMDSVLVCDVRCQCGKC